MKAPVISVVIPTHSRNGLLARAVHSVLAQSTPPDEIVVSDDVGAEETRGLVEELAATTDVTIRYHDSSMDAGGTAGANRNSGVRVASGELIAFLDDDDTWDSRFLSDLGAALESSSTASFAVTWTRQVRDDFSERGLEMPSGVAAHEALGRNPGLTGSNALYRSEVGTRLGWFDPSLSVSNDQDFLVRLLDSGASYVVVPMPLVDQHGHDLGQLTARTERRALGLESFRAKYADRLTSSDRRAIAYQIHSIRRVTAPSAISRSGHLLAQLLSASPRTLALRVMRRLSGAPSIYRGVQDSSGRAAG